MKLSDNPYVAIGSRGEGISYRDDRKVLGIDYDGTRLVAEGMNQWSNGARLLSAEQEIVFRDVLRFLRRHWERAPIVVINRDDPSRELWERLSAARRLKTEYTTDAETFEFHRSALLRTFEIHGHVKMNGREMSTREEVERYARQHFTRDRAE